MTINELFESNTPIGIETEQLGLIYFTIEAIDHEFDVAILEGQTATHISIEQAISLSKLQLLIDGGEINKGVE